MNGGADPTAAPDGAWTRPCLNLIRPGPPAVKSGEHGVGDAGRLGADFGPVAEVALGGADGGGHRPVGEAEVLPGQLAGEDPVGLPTAPV